LDLGSKFVIYLIVGIITKTKIKLFKETYCNFSLVVIFFEGGHAYGTLGLAKEL